MAERAVEAAVASTLARIGRGLYGVACSGGADSMALAAAAIAVAGPAAIVVIAIDHGLTAASAAAAAGVAAWARGQGAAAVVERVVVARRASVEAAARAARYAALDRLVERLGLAAMLVGHTARDQAETVLLRIVRGTGPAGLAAIPAVRGPYHRPLLAVSRAQTEAYVAARGLPVWEDAMNADHRLARVRLRAEIMPRLRAENAQLDAALLRLAAAAGEWLAVIDAAAAPWARFPIACGALAGQPAAVRKRALAQALEAAGLGYDAAQLEVLDRLVGGPARGERGVDVEGGRIVRSYDQLVVQAAAVAGAAVAVVVAPGHALRVWQPGDRMRPARLRGRSRKLSDLYIDAKIPRAARVCARVLVCLATREIVWAEHLGAAFGTGKNSSLAPPE